MTKIYELVNKKEGASFSPYVISTLLFLKHKNIQFERVGLTFTELGPTIRKLTNDEWSCVPTVEFDNGDIIFDSPKIADYLDEKYPSNPLKTSNPELEEFVSKFRPEVGLFAFKLVVLDTFHACEGEDQAYMRSAREKDLGQSLEEFGADPIASFNQLIQNLQPLVKILETSKFVEGENPAYSDYIVAGCLHWIRALNSKLHTRILEALTPEVRRWSSKMDDLFDGFLGSLKIIN